MVDHVEIWPSIRDDFMEVISLAVATTIDGERFRLAKVEWGPIDTTSYYDTVLAMNRTEAQALMDRLWKCGIRPTEGMGSAGALAATKEHLEDMRRLVFEGRQSYEKGKEK